MISISTHVCSSCREVLMQCGYMRTNMLSSHRRALSCWFGYRKKEASSAHYWPPNQHLWQSSCLLDTCQIFVVDSKQLLILVLSILRKWREMPPFMWSWSGICNCNPASPNSERSWRPMLSCRNFHQSAKYLKCDPFAIGEQYKSWAIIITHNQQSCSAYYTGWPGW